MSAPFEHVINSRILTTFSSIQDELKINPDKNYLFDLSYLAVLTVHGEKASDVLQGQLTCDVRMVSNQRMLQGAYCNLKGRILTLLDIINWDGLKLILPQDLIDSTQHSLNKAALLSRVKLEQNKDIKCLGFFLQNANDLVPEPVLPSNALYEQMQTKEACSAHLGSGFYIILLHENNEQALIDAFKNKGQFKGSLTWHTLRMKQKHIEIYPNSKGLFLPHRLDLHLSAYLSFNKGCYKGQEIIARTHYRATLKHEMRLLSVHSHEAIFSGQRIMDEVSKMELGELVDYSYLGDAHYLIAVSMLKDAPQNVRFEGHNNTLQLDIR